MDLAHDCLRFVCLHKPNAPVDKAPDCGHIVYTFVT